MDDAGTGRGALIEEDLWRVDTGEVLCALREAALGGLTGGTLSGVSARRGWEVAECLVVATEVVEEWLVV